MDYHEAEIRKDERHRLAALLEGSAEYLVDFTGSSTLGTIELIVFLLRLDHTDENIALGGDAPVSDPGGKGER